MKLNVKSLLPKCGRAVNEMKKTAGLMAALMLTALPGYADCPEQPVIEVTGSATLYIVPDRISIEIGMEEYYKRGGLRDSTIVKLADIEKNVRRTLNRAGVPDSLIVVSDLGNYRNRDLSSSFLMAKRLTATVTDFSRIEYISEKLDRNGITSFNITRTDNSDMAQYNRQGLRSALDAARQKAEFIAENENLTIIAPIEIVETSSEPGGGYAAYSNVAYEGGSGMENLRRIVRRYSVKVRYVFNPAVK